MNRARSIIENDKKKLLKDRKFRNRVNELSQKLVRSQAEAFTQRSRPKRAALGMVKLTIRERRSMISA